MSENEKGTTAVSGNESIHYRVAIRLKGLGLTANLKGYRYLRSAIALAYDDFNVVEMMTKYLYPAIAKEFDATPSRVERAMRHAVEIAYGPKSKPTVSSFIANMADELRMEDGKF